MPRTPDASSFTQFTKVNAQSIQTTKTPTASSVPSIATLLKGVVASTVKASTVAVSASPQSAIVATSALKANTKKRG